MDNITSNNVPQPIKTIAVSSPVTSTTTPQIVPAVQPVAVPKPITQVPVTGNNIVPKLKTEADAAVDDAVDYDHKSEDEAEQIPDTTLDLSNSEERLNNKSFADTLKMVSEMSVCVPLGTADDMDAVTLATVKDSAAEHPLEEDYDVMRAGAARSYINEAFDTYDKSLKAAAAQHPEVPLSDKLVTRVAGVGDDPGNIPTPKTKEVNVTGYRGFIAMMAMTGGLRRVTLWNSGIQLRLRNPSIDQLIAFQRDLDEMNSSYGATMGYPYYLFAEALINSSLIDDFLPKVVTNSNTEFKNDWSALKRHISYQDYQTILLGLLSMMYPNGIKTNFICGNSECRHRETMVFDLSRLHLINREMIPEEAVKHFYLKEKVTAQQIQEYKKLLDLDKELTFTYNIEDTPRKWKLHLRQCTLSEWCTAGREYLHTLETMNFKQARDVSLFISTTDLRMLKPWISKIETVMVRNGESYTYVISNDGSDTYASMAIDEIMQEWMTYYPEIKQQIIDYILGTRISHSAFYFPKCPKCGTPSNVSTQGYIAYDALYGFFSLSQLKVMQAIRTNIKNTTTTM